MKCVLYKFSCYQFLLVRMGVKYLRSNFVILDPLSPCTCTYAFNLQSFPLNTDINFLKRYDSAWTETYFVNYYQSKNHKQIYYIKKLLYKAIGKLRIKTPRRALESSLHILTVRERWEWIILAVWIAHFVFLFHFYFVTNLRKKIMAYVRLQLNLLLPLYDPVRS